ncbi:MAG: N-formylglutamate deformylase [Xanthomonadales bacterium]|nr:N-formylglutamate deformylase [Xanthomonadales bacterium]
MTNHYSLEPREAPMLISVPHAGTDLPGAIAETMTRDAVALPDTDWFVDRLYAFARQRDVGIIRAHVSRYVIDMNRAPDGARLYPGRAETELCPTTLFDGRPVYRPGAAPDAEEIDARRQRYWQPYHDGLRRELGRLRALHGRVLLWDAHSIRSRVPRLFDGILPDLNFGTGGGPSCAAALTTAIVDRARAFNQFNTVLNGRFKGGYITRQYGEPGAGIDAIQLEIAQSAYMDETNPVFDPERAAPLIRVLEAVVDTALQSLS